MAPIKEQASFISRYSVAVFYIIAVVFGTGMVYLVVQAVIPSGLALASVLSASIAGIIVTGLEDGASSLELMLKRLLIWRVRIGYWLFGLFFIIPAVLLGSLLNPIFNGEPISFKDLQSPFPVLPMFFTFVVVAGVGQELGWTGFITPRLQTRFNALTSCLIRAVLVGLWHLPLFIYSSQQNPAIADFQYSGWIAQKGFLVAFLTMVLMFQIPWSIFIGWIFNNTGGSLLLVAILHGSEVWLAYILMSAGIDPGNLDNYWGYGVVLIISAAMIVIVNGPQNLSRECSRIQHQPVNDDQAQFVE
jgi:membrane protease YdiL (CAAX protease family)